MLDFLAANWHWTTSAGLLAIDVWATGHAVLRKRDQQSALAWVGLIWLVPIAGAALYVVFGINRVRRKARRLRRNAERLDDAAPGVPPTPAALDGLDALRHFIDGVTGRPLKPGNAVAPLLSGAEAYDEMLAGIARATRTIGLSTYIFDNDRTGGTFIAALADAVRRGVAVRVLIDDIGARYSFPSAVGRLRAAGVRVERFMPSWLPWRFAYAQLRSHRKFLLLDGRLGFTGGMNLRDGHDARRQPRHPIVDCHFRVEGPAVADLRGAFADDWLFAAGERLSGAAWFPELLPAGGVAARGIASGPDDDFETLKLAFLGALACARRSVRIVSPYFLPDGALTSALGVAARRGVAVEILLPERNNLRLVQWAMTGHLGQVLEHGCRVWLTPPPFDHSKLFVVDDAWCLVGSANWDSRSLRLNFEFDLECYDAELAGALNAVVECKLAASRRLTTDELDDRPLFRKLRDGVARLAAPYL